MKEILFNKYEILKVLGKGGFSTVFLVKDLHLNELRAVKRINKCDDVEIELKTLKELSHEGLPIIYDYRKDEQYAYIVMEFIEGITLREYMDKSKVDLNTCLIWVRQMLDIIEYLHSFRPMVIYRDLKPDNIMIRVDGKVKLIDFGAVLLREYGFNEIKDNYGTKGYTAPEIFKGKRATASADIYSIGAIIHEMLSGANPNKAPFLRKSLREYDKAIPKGIERIVNKCLDNNCDKRYETVSDLKDDIMNYDKNFFIRDMLFYAKKIMVYMFFVMAFVDFAVKIKDGINASIEDISMALCKPIALLIAGIVLYRIFISNHRKYDVKVKKDIILTEKKYIGLLATSIIGVIATAVLAINFIGTQNAYAVESSENIEVTLCDSYERKMLLKNDCVYDVEDKLRLEISKIDIPKGVVTVKVIAYGNDGKSYTSREFKVRSKQELYTK